MGDLIQTFRRTLAKIAEIERRIVSDQIEIATLRGEIDEIRGALQADPVAGPIMAAEHGRKRPIRDGSSVGWAKRVLQMAHSPMYVDDIITNIEHMTGLPVRKATLVSNLSRYVKAGDTFKRTGANTFALIEYEEPNEMRLVG